MIGGWTTEPPRRIPCRPRRCIDACNAYAQACEHCSDACIEQNRIDHECLMHDGTEICWMAIFFMNRGSGYAYLVCGSSSSRRR